MFYMTFDIETTGLDIYKDQPIQLAYQIHNDINIRQIEVMIYIHPEKLLSPIITAITGITDDILSSKGLSNQIAIKNWQSILWSFQPISLIGYNLINFDFPMIQNWINKFCSDRFKFPPVYQIYDVMHMVGYHFKTVKWLKLAEAAKRCGIKFNINDLHNAMVDVRLTKRIFDILGGN